MILKVADINTVGKLHWIYILTVLATVAEVFSVGAIIPIFSNTDSILRLVGLGDISNPVIVATSIFAIIFIVKSVFVLWVISVQNRYAYSVQKQLSMKIFSGLVSLNYEKNARKGRDYFISLINVDVIHFRDTLLLVILLMTESLVVIALISVAIFVFPSLTILTGSIFVLGMASFRMVFAPLSQRFGKRRILADFSKNSWLSGTLDSLDVIHAQRLSEFFKKSFMDSVDEVSKVGAKQGALNQAPRFMFEILAMLCIVVATLVSEIGGSAFVLGDGTSGYSYVVMGAIAFRLLPSINRIVGALQGINYGQAAVLELNELFENSEQTAVNYLSCAPDEGFKEAIVEIEAVSLTKVFGQSKILNGGCAKFSKGNIYAILGKSGSGKSTFVKVMLGLYKKCTGEIYLNGILKDFRLIDLDNAVALVPQNVSVIEGSVLDNILMGRDFSPDKLESVVAILDWVSDLPFGCETVVGSKGVVLSGGQVQRLGIARAFYSSPDIVILDESTSALDLASQETVIKYLEKKSKSCIIIVVTHRTEILEICDEVFRVESGVISK